MAPTTDLNPPAAETPTRGELLETALRYAYEHDRSTAFDYDTWRAACELLLSPPGERPTTTLALQAALDSYREGPTELAQEIAHARALWSTLQSALVGGQVGGDPESPRNYIAVIFEGMRLPFERAEVHFIKPGGMTPHEKAARLEGQQAFATRTIRRLNDELVEARRLLDGARETAEQGRAAVQEATRELASATEREHKSHLANADLAWLVADRIWAGEIRFEPVGGFGEGERAVREDDSPLSQRERGMAQVVDELRDQLADTRRAIATELRGLKIWFDARWDSAVEGRDDDKNLDDELRAVAEQIASRLKIYEGER